MRIELELEGHRCEVVALNRPNSASSGAELVNVCSFPLWQDEVEVGVSASLGLHKDDLLVLDRSGTLTALIASDPYVSTDLTTPEGYARVKDAVLAVW